jgi:glutamyl-tRNA synthetase
MRLFMLCLQRKITTAIGDITMRTLSKGDVLQLERRGYYIVDVAYDSQQPDQPIVLFNIPDGRTKNMP